MWKSVGELMYNVNKHHAIVGITGSGKTYFSTWEYHNIQNRAIFINTSDEYFPEKYSDVIVYDIDGFLEAFNSGKKKICFSPQTEKDITVEDLIQIRDILFAYGSEVNKGRKEPLVWCHIYIDEIQEFSNKKAPNSEIDSFFKRGRRKGITAIAISQRPAEVSHTILNNCSAHIIFKLSSFEKTYFTTYRIPIFETDKEEWIKQQYYFVVFDGYDLKEGYPVKLDY